MSNYGIHRTLEMTMQKQSKPIIFFIKEETIRQRSNMYPYDLNISILIVRNKFLSVFRHIIKNKKENGHKTQKDNFHTIRLTHGVVNGLSELVIIFIARGHLHVITQEHDIVNHGKSLTLRTCITISMNKCAVFTIRMNKQIICY